MPLNKPNWVLRQEELAKPELDWDALKEGVGSLAMYEKLRLFERRDCPEWLLLHMYRLGSQMCLANEKDINQPLRDIARKRLKEINKLPDEEARTAS